MVGWWLVVCGWWWLVVGGWRLVVGGWWEVRPHMPSALLPGCDRTCRVCCCQAATLILCYFEMSGLLPEAFHTSLFLTVCLASRNCCRRRKTNRPPLRVAFDGAPQTFDCLGFNPIAMATFAAAAAAGAGACENIENLQSHNNYVFVTTLWKCDNIF